MEQPTLSAIFGKRLRLIAAPKFCPMPHKPKDEGTLVVAEISEKVSELRVTSVISWPVAQERSFERALENWRIILVDNSEASDLERQIRSIVDGENQDLTVEQVILDALGRKRCFYIESKSFVTDGFCKVEEISDSRCYNFSCF